MESTERVIKKGSIWFEYKLENGEVYERYDSHRVDYSDGREFKVSFKRDDPWYKIVYSA